MIAKGLVGTEGGTSRVPSENLTRMRILIDRSLSEVRMRADPELHTEKFSLNGFVNQILLTAKSKAANKNRFCITVSGEVSHKRLKKPFQTFCLRRL